LTNEIGVDEDIATDPFLYIYPPNPSRDSPLRKLQGFLFPLPLSLLFVIWKFDSFKLAVTDMMNGFKRKTQQELLFMAIHWAIVFKFVPLPVVIAYTFLSGFITALIVTVTHQSEELFDEHNPDFVDAQFRSTRDAKCRTPFTEWLWGGMQYQLEHHLFPSMPRSKYPALAKVLQQFAVDNKVEFRITDEFELIGMNIDMYNRISKLPSSPTARHYEGKDKSWGGRGEVVSY
jgi:acyl-lipid Delta6-acetylenase / acyl-lipid (9-3)-desaturase